MDDQMSHPRLLPATFRYRDGRMNDPGGQGLAGLIYARKAIDHSMLTVTRADRG